MAVPPPPTQALKVQFYYTREFMKWVREMSQLFDTLAIYPSTHNYLRRFLPTLFVNSPVLGLCNFYIHI